MRADWRWHFPEPRHDSYTATQRWLWSTGDGTRLRSHTLSSSCLEQTEACRPSQAVYPQISPHMSPHLLQRLSRRRVVVRRALLSESLGRAGWWTVVRAADQALSSGAKHYVPRTRQRGARQRRGNGPRMTSCLTLCHRGSQRSRRRVLPPFRERSVVLGEL